MEFLALLAILGSVLTIIVFLAVALNDDINTTKEVRMEETILLHNIAKSYIAFMIIIICSFIVILMYKHGSIN